MLTEPFQFVQPDGFEVDGILLELVPGLTLEQTDMARCPPAVQSSFVRPIHCISI